MEIDLLALGKAVLRGWKWIVLAMAVFGVGAFLATKLLITPTYESYFTAYVNSAENKDASSVTSSEISASRSLTSTYSVIITSRLVVEKAIAAAGVSCTYEDLKDAITVKAVDDTEIIRVSVVTDTPQTSYALSGAMEQVAADSVSEIVIGSTMVIVSPSGFPKDIYAPSTKKNTAIGILAGFVLAFVILVLRELLSNRVKDSDELAARYGYAVIGTVHDLEAKVSSNYGYYGHSANNKEEE